MPTSISDRYRLKTPTIGLFCEDDRQVARMVPKGAVITVGSETFDSDKLVEVMWSEKKVLMFPQDIRARGIKLD